MSKLNNLDDILAVYRIDVLKVPGYDTLPKVNQELYKKFIFYFFNAWGLEARATIIPLAIHFVEEIELLGKERVTDDYYILIGLEIYCITNAVDSKNLLKSWQNDEYSHLDCVLTEHKKYVRFEYRIDGRDEGSMSLMKIVGINRYNYLISKAQSDIYDVV